MIDYIKEFLVLCEYRNYTKASEVLYIVPSTLSRHISALEKNLGAILIERNNSSFELTNAGELLLDKGTDLVSNYDALINQLISGKHSANKIITIYSEPFNSNLLFDIYRTFQEKHKDVIFNFRMIPLVPEKRELVLDMSDILITAEEYIDMNLSEYKVFNLLKDKVNIIGAKKNPLFNEENFNFEKLSDHPLLLLKGKDLMSSTYKRLESEIKN